MALTRVLQVGETCPGLAQLSVINARVVVGRGRDHCARESSCALFPRLQQLYLYLVQYLPALSLGCPAPSVTTGLHLLLSHAPLLTSLQCPGSPLLTDKVQTQKYFQLTLTLFMSPLAVRPGHPQHGRPLPPHQVRGVRPDLRGPPHRAAVPGNQTRGSIVTRDT